MRATRRASTCTELQRSPCCVCVPLSSVFEVFEWIRPSTSAIALSSSIRRLASAVMGVAASSSSSESLALVELRD